MILLTFVNGILDVNLINLGIIVLVISIASSLIALCIAGITIIGAFIWAIITG